ncbi:MAG: SCO family protein, partial [Pseudomonadota bacterium]|nr:SCO family protein [Pseudomonadota bacterium]
MFNRTTLIIVALAAIVAGLFAGFKLYGAAGFRLHHPLQSVAAAVTPACPPMQALKCFDKPRPLPPFELLRHDGSALTNESLKGHWTLVFIGFTHCPDVC